MSLDNVRAGLNPPEEINVIIEVPAGGAPVKYEMHKRSGEEKKMRYQSVFLARSLFLSFPG